MSDDRSAERLMIWAAIILFIVAVVWLTSGCATQTKTVYERVEVPKPYREYPTNVKPTPPELDLQSSHVTPAEAKADPTPALVVVGQDLNLCVSSHEQLRRDYEELRKLCVAPVEPTPTPE